MTKGRRWWAIAGLAALVAAAFGWAFAPRPIEVEVGHVARGAFAATIDEDGRTRLRDRYVLAAPLAGQLTRIALREGDDVAAGQPVALLQPALSPLLDERTRRELQARLDGALAEAQRASAQAAAADVALAQARSELLRSEALAADGFLSAARRDADRLAAQAAARQHDAAVQAQHVAQHAVEQARSALAAVPAPGNGRPPAGASADAQPLQLRAPVAGRVLRIAQGSETPVAAGAPLLEIGDTRRMEVVAELLTADALRAAPGSRVHIERWGGPPLLGRVRLVEPAAFTKVSALGVEEQRVEVLIDIETEPETWRALGDGYRVAVRIVAQAADDALLVPVAALFPLPGEGGEAERDAGAGSGVFVLEAGRARLRPVRIAARNDRVGWVAAGLRAGETVIVYAPPAVRDGARVRPRRS